VLSDCNMIMSQLDFMSRQSLLTLKKDLYSSSGSLERVDNTMSDKVKAQRASAFRERQEKDSQMRQENLQRLLQSSRPTFTPSITSLAKGIEQGQKAHIHQKTRERAQAVRQEELIRR